MEKREIKLCFEKQCMVSEGRNKREKENKRPILQRKGKYLVGGEEEEGKKKRRLINWKTKRLEDMYCGRMEERVSIKSEDSVVARPLSSNIVQ